MSMEIEEPILAEVAEVYRRNLPPGAGEPFDVGGLDRLGTPVVIAPYRTTLGGQFDGFGYGLSRESALVGALGELTESAFCEKHLSEAAPVAGSYRHLVSRHGKEHVADPLTLCLPAGSPYTPDTPLEWVPGTRHATGETVWLPLECVAIGPGMVLGRTPLFRPITNGLGAGLSLERALSHGLCELLQRDGNCTSFRALDRGVVIDLDDYEFDDPLLSDELEDLAERGVRVTVKLAGVEFGMVSVYVVGTDEDPDTLPIMQTACGEAAHPDREAAVLKALCEFRAARCRKAFMHGPLDAVRRVAPSGYLENYLKHFDWRGEEQRCLRAEADWMTRSAAELRATLADTVFRESRRVRLEDLPTAANWEMADPGKKLHLVAGRLIEAGHDVLYVRLTPPGSPVVAVKAVVRELECETMSYHRVGERGIRRLMEMGETWAGVGKPPAGARRVPLTAEAEARLGGPAWLDTDAIDRIVGPLYALYREPNSHAVQLFLEAQKRGEA